jgi:hypothetical protein
MSKCIYNGKRLIPCPFITLNKTFERLDDGTLIGTMWQGTIRGKILSHMGSPNRNGSFWIFGGFPPDDVVDVEEKLGAIFRKQEAIRSLFSEDGYLLEFQSLDGSAPMKCNPRITGITFEEGDWFTVCNYSITFDADIIYVNGGILGEDLNTYFIKSGGETWQIETNEDQVEDIGLRTYRLTHEVQAQGKRIFNPDGTISMPAWHRAKEYVVARLGFDPLILSGSSVKDLPDYYNGYNHVRSESIDENGGSYSVTETWLLSSGTAIEDFSISCSETLESSLTLVTIDGTITGLESRNSNMGLTISKYSGALLKFDSVSGTIYSRACNYSGKNLNYKPLQSTFTRSPNAGSLTYSYQYDDRPSNLIGNSLSEVFSVQDSFDNDVIAIIPVPGRAKGPILQDIGTKTERIRNVNVEIVMPIPSGNLAERYSSTPYDVVNTLVNDLKPVGYQVFQTENSPSWDLKTGRFSLNRAWTWEEI